MLRKYEGTRVTLTVKGSVRTVHIYCTVHLTVSLMTDTAEVKEHQPEFMKRLFYMFLTVYIKLIGIKLVESL